MTETTWSRQEIVAQLVRSPHGDLPSYVAPTTQALRADAEFVAHLIAWHAQKGSIRDANIALPAIALTHKGFDEDHDNALAHLALLAPRDLDRAWHFAKDLKVSDRVLKRLVTRYLKAREANRRWWDSAVMHDKRSMKNLYKVAHVKPSERAERILLRRRRDGTVFEILARLPTMDASEIVGAVTHFKLPHQAVKGALGKRASDPALLRGVLASMSPAEVVTNAEMLRELGVTAQPETRALFEEKLGQLEAFKRPAVRAPLLKTARAADAVEKAGGTQLAARLRGAQGAQLEAAQGIDANVLMIIDKSGSMEKTMEIGRQVTAALAKLVRGRVHCVFVDTMPRVFDATGKTYEQLLKETQRLDANGGTSLGCGLRYALEQRWDVDVIVLVTDGAENQHPTFADVYPLYVQRIKEGEAVPVFYLKVAPFKDLLSRQAAMVAHEEAQFRLRCQAAKIELQQVEVSGTDYYAIPTLVELIRPSLYSLVDEIWQTPLKTLDEVLPPLKTKEGVGV